MIDNPMEDKKQRRDPLFYSRNPFVTGGPVRYDDFFGRENILDKVISFLRKKNEVNMLIYGQRRIGKTSLLRKLQKEAKKLQLARPVYFNLQDEYNTPMHRLLHDIAGKIRLDLKSDLEVKEEDFSAAEGSVPGYFKRDFIPLVIEKLPPNQSLLLLFDETDVMAPRENGKDNTAGDTLAGKSFIPFFADLIEEIRYNKYPVKLIFAVGRKYREPGQKQFDRLAKFGSQLEIWYYTRRETEDLLKIFAAPPILFEEDAVAAIYAITAGHPFFTQCLAGESFKAAEKNNSKTVSPGIVKDQLIPSLNKYSVGVYWIWDSLDDRDQAVLYLMAFIKEENKPVNIETLLKKAGALDLEFSVEDLRRILNRLKSFKFIKETHQPGNKYDFYIEFFRRWIVNKFSGKVFVRE